MGELHLEVLVQRMRDDFGVALRVGQPSVAYRETITSRVDGHAFRLSKQTGGPGQFAHVVIDVEPCEEDFVFVDTTSGGRVPAELARATMQGARDALVAGPVGGHPMVGVKVTLTDGSTHPKDSTELAFRSAGFTAVREALVLADPVRLEPVMAVEVVVPEEFLGNVLGDVASRRGSVKALGSRSGARTVEARVPLAELVGFATHLRSRTEGRGDFTMELSSYEVAG